MSDKEKEAYKAKLRSLCFKPTGPKYVDTKDQIWTKPDEQKDVRDAPGFYD
jgi:hypothetical protein